MPWWVWIVIGAVAGVAALVVFAWYKALESWHG